MQAISAAESRLPHPVLQAAGQLWRILNFDNSECQKLGDLDDLVKFSSRFGDDTLSREQVVVGFYLLQFIVVLRIEVKFTSRFSDPRDFDIPWDLTSATQTVCFSRDKPKDSLTYNSVVFGKPK